MFRDCVGKSGGLALLWNSETDIRVLAYSRSHIEAFVKGDNGFYFSLFYGNPRANMRRHSWDLLRLLKGRAVGSWLVMGDFNEIIHQGDMYVRRERNRSSVGLWLERH